MSANCMGNQTMFAEVFAYMMATSWILLSLCLYVVHYVYEVVLDLPISGESPCSAHASLKKSIQRFIREASELQDLRSVHHSNTPPNTSESETSHRTYEDVLSTAIINTVVQNYQTKPSPSASSTPKTSEPEYFIGEPNLEAIVQDLDDASSLSSSGSPKYCNQMNSPVIRRKCKGMSSSEERERNAWERNWLLCRKDFTTGSKSPVPVPMLVPNPTSNCKVLIGDRDAEDTTDLSDAASDYDDSLESCSLNAVLVNSKTIIGGKNPLDRMYNEDNKSLSFDLHSDDNDDDVVIETLNSGLVNIDLDDTGACADIEDYSLVSVESNTEKDSEYTEQYATLPRKIPKDIVEENHKSMLMNEFYDDGKGDNGDSGVTSDEDDRKQAQRFQGSSYAEREKEKWNHAVNIPNNPYSKSNLEHRLSNRSSKTSRNSNFISAKTMPKEHWIANEEMSKSNDEESKLVALASVDDAHQSDCVESIIAEEKLIRATPILTSPRRMQSWDVSSDSDYSIERTYNINSGRIIKKHGDIEYEVPSNGKQYASEATNGEQINLEDIEEAEDSSISPVVPPAVNHFKLVNDIANESSDQYHIVPISPPAEYKTVESHVKSFNDISLNELTATDEANHHVDDFHDVQPSMDEDELRGLKEQHIVSNLLTAFSKSHVLVPNDMEMEESLSALPTLLGKGSMRAEKHDIASKKDVYSLTARSLPKHVRQELAAEVKSRSKNSTQAEVTVETKNIDKEPRIVFPNAKSRIAYWEHISKQQM